MNKLFILSDWVGARHVTIYWCGHPINTFETTIKRGNDTFVKFKSRQGDGIDKYVGKALRKLAEFNASINKPKDIDSYSMHRIGDHYYFDGVLLTLMGSITSGFFVRANTRNKYSRGFKSEASFEEFHKSLWHIISCEFPRYLMPVFDTMCKDRKTPMPRKLSLYIDK